MINYGEEFIKLEEEKNALRKLQNQLSTLEKEITDVRYRYNTLKDSLLKEKRDVDHLESLSLSYIFHKIKGTMDKQVSKEKYEYLDARAKFIEVENYLNKLLSNKEALNSDICDIGNIELKYNDLLERATDYIKSLNNKESEDVIRILNEIKSLQLSRKNIAKAVFEGESLMPVVDDTISNLIDALDYGSADMRGRGLDLVATMAKRSRMYDASTAINSIKVMLTKYNTDLNDLREDINTSLDLDGFSGTIDIFFDNFFTDYFAQSKIESALRSAKVIRYKVLDIQKSLKSQLINIDFSITGLRKALEKVIIT